MAKRLSSKTKVKRMATRAAKRSLGLKLSK